MSAHVLSVAHVITRLNVGGPARHVSRLMRDLPRLGIEPSLITGVEAPGEGRIDPGVAHRVVRSLVKPIDPRRDLRAFRALHAVLRDDPPDIVHTHLAKAGALGRSAARRAGVPVLVHTFHGHVLDGYFGATSERAFLETERALARRTNALVAVSTAVRDELLALGIGGASRWHVIPLALDMASLLADPQPERAAAREILGLPQGVPLIGIVGRLVQIKDHATFLAAAGLVAERDGAVGFVIAGDGEERAKLEAAVPGHLRDRVHFTGWVQDLPMLYAALDLVALTSRNEGTPVALMEAAAAGKPVVATRVGGVPDVVHEGRTGLLVPPGDPDEVAEALRRLLADPEGARTMGANARAQARERAAAEHPSARLAELYRALV